SSRDEQTTRTMDGTGRTQSSSAVLVTVSRAGQARSSPAVAVRTAAGPPPRTTGTRKLSAPTRTWAIQPAARGAVSWETRAAAVVHEVVDSRMPVRATRDPVSQTTPAATDQAAKERGGFVRASRSQGVPAMT